MTRYLLLAALALLLSLACRPERLPPPDVRPVLVQLDRIESRLLDHKLTVARWRCQR